MAKSKYEYVKSFEQDDRLLPECWIVVRIDGRGFHKFADAHKYAKPNDMRGLQLMNRCAANVMEQHSDIVVAFGESDEFSFVLRRSTALFQRRASKIVSVICSLFASSFVFHWKDHFDEKTDPLQYPPSFDGRAVCYPSTASIRDYLSWRQVDTHINNQYNTCFWLLVQQGGLSAAAAQLQLKGTTTNDKNELMFDRYGINYSKLPAMFRKGSVLVREREEVLVKTSDEGFTVNRMRSRVAILHEDIIQDHFWEQRPQLLAS
mmetsp:Transcript_11392/g.41694  ORF Transcript_11392/g.41694 Transcript_11392/m.41694 type:complete len:262 (+) Transcript_11392:83-868(+)